LIFVAGAVSSYLVFGAIEAEVPPNDIAIAALVVDLALLASLAAHRIWLLAIVRFAAYVAAIIVTYFAGFLGSDGWFANIGIDLGILALACAVALTLAFQRREEFQVTTLDLLVLIDTTAVAAVMFVTPFGLDLDLRLTPMIVIRLVIVLYAIELLLGRKTPRWQMVAGASVISLGTIGLCAIGS